jgi:hypothetical protein
MARKRRRSSRRWISTVAALAVLLAFAIYDPILNWWQSMPPTSKFLLFAATGFVLMTVTGIGLTIYIYRKQKREKTWRLAMAGWQDNSPGDEDHQKQSAMHLSDLELEKLAEQVYKRLGYKVQHIGQTGDHGIDVLLINPNNQKEIVQCKQWSKPVGGRSHTPGSLRRDDARSGCPRLALGSARLQRTCQSVGKWETHRPGR